VRITPASDEHGEELPDPMRRVGAVLEGNARKRVGEFFLGVPPLLVLAVLSYLKSDSSP
jgi:hypothetical protein